MNRFLYVSYREWAFIAYSETGLNFPHVKSNDELERYLIANDTVEYIFFVGWSDLVPQKYLTKYCCLCIHPSMLPLYRGGSPIQNQIIDGVLDSGVTLFMMDNGIDTGPIFSQKYLSLRGSLNEILQRVSFVTAVLIREFSEAVLTGVDIVFIPQNDVKSTFFKRRKPCESEITIEDLQILSSVDLYNKIRALDDPYPNAFIKCSDGKKMYIKKVWIE